MLRFAGYGLMCYGIGDEVSDASQLDRSLLQWLIGGAGAFILFLLSLGIVDLTKKLNKITQLCLDIERLKAKYDKDVAELHGELKLISQRVDDAQKD